MSLKQLLQKKIKSSKATTELLTEGGNAFSSVVRINQLNCDPTFKEFEDKILKKLGSQFAVLGSFDKKNPNENGKNPEGSCGDMDVAVKGTYEDILTDIKNLCKDLKYNFREFKGLNVISIEFPIVNNDSQQPGKKVQCDIMPVDDVEYCKWSYYSPSFDESEFKGLYRNEILFACAKYVEQIVHEEDSDSPTVWERYFYNLSNGLMRGKQTNRGKNGKKIKTITTLEKKLITSKPQEIVNILFGESFSAEELVTWEQCWKAIHSDKFVLKDKLPLILKQLKRNLESKGVELPKGL